jgi:hypothetical protein
LAQIVKRISGLHFNIPQRRLILGFQHWRLFNTAS